MNRLAMMLLRNAFRLPGLYIQLCRYAKHPERYQEREMFAHIRRIMQVAIEKGNVELVVTGKENIPQQDGMLVYANHQGMFDIVAIGATWETAIGAVLKKELKNVIMLKQIIACTKSFPLDREDVRQSLKVIQAVTQEVKAGRNYLIFPEGTRSKTGNQMGEFHGGSFRCALKAQCPILPVAFIDAYKVLDQKGSDPVTVQMHFLKPIPYEEYKDLKTTELADLVKGRIAEAIEANT